MNSSCESFIKTEHANSTATHTHTRGTTVDSHIPSTLHYHHHHPKHHPACETRSFISRTSLDSPLCTPAVTIHVPTATTTNTPQAFSICTFSGCQSHLSSSTCTYQSCVSPQPLSTLALLPLPNRAVAFSCSKWRVPYPCSNFSFDNEA